MKQRSMWFGWKAGLLAELAAGSKTAQTTKGFIEYSVLGSGPVLLAIHGTPGGYDQGLLHFRELTSRGFSVLAPSRPGYLRTPIGGGYTPADQADLMEALLDSLGLDRVVVAGFSAGGPCALEFAARFPKRTAGLILFSAVTGKYERDRSRDSFFGKLFDYDLGSWLIALLAHYSPDLMVKAMVDAGGVFAEESVLAERITDQILMVPEKVAFVAEVIDTMVPASKRRRGVENDLQQLANLPEIPFDRIKAPALVMHGALDREVPCAHATYAASRIPGSELMLIEEGFHLLGLGLNAGLLWDRMAQFCLRTKLQVSRLNDGL